VNLPHNKSFLYHNIPLSLAEFIFHLSHKVLEEPLFLRSSPSRRWSVYLGGGSAYVPSLLRKSLVKIQMSLYTTIYLPTHIPSLFCPLAHRGAADLHPPQSVAPQPPAPQPPALQIVDWAAVRASIPKNFWTISNDRMLRVVFRGIGQGKSGMLPSHLPHVNLDYLSCSVCIVCLYLMESRMYHLPCTVTVCRFSFLYVAITNLKWSG